ncbi:hypothetical protein [Phaeobacter sp. B1627]|uniref:hypothetical protein n=1 Tax=Phaeobacter sp. B1627 TaxID=2583809 RepID=UPI001119A974|nr:hypothetical protein [Phaeobacter sp. B1627]TNJ42679.1 hypothetical protein FGE21_10260 [Phaeobacter sp. B1627]
MPISALPAKDGLKKALRLISGRVASLGPSGRLSMPPVLPSVLPLSAATGWTRRTGPDHAPAPLLQLEDVLSIPVPETNAENDATDRAIAEGQFLARQDRWDRLEARIAEVDLAGAATPGGTSIADLIAFGARADVINAVDHALSAGLPLTDRVTLEGIMSLERVRLETGRTPVMSTVVALAHLDIAWACRRNTTRRASHGKGAPGTRAMAHHTRAGEILSTLPDSCKAHPFHQAARCALYSGGGAAAPRQIADDYSDLIRLTPGNPRHLRALGTHLVEQGPEGLSVLELEARRVAALVEPQWGAAGYTWVYFDALARSDAACRTVDVGFFLDGVADIVARAPDQDRVNLLSAYCSIVVKPEPEADPAARRVRSEIAEAANWLIRNHLRELNPLIWAHADAGFDNDAQVSSARKFAERGRNEALRAIAGLFREDIEAGHRVVFTPDGPRVMSD